MTVFAVWITLKRIPFISFLSARSFKLVGFFWPLNGILRLTISLCSCELERSLDRLFLERSLFLPCGLCRCTEIALFFMEPLFLLILGGVLWRR
ncbi:hypothetical protein HU200_056108 [Digitaria exilis]|uniref:Uncharacterized protein n=1 Tax=Digitaria exilis TaxID=1010633 RepID=A0A835ALZ6_9POAL|nr:hypothetical protein HU200_056108 [Digitaria exilis]